MLSCQYLKLLSIKIIDKKERVIKRNIVLLVDDERTILSVLDHQITSHFKDHVLLEFASSGQEALELYKEYWDSGAPIGLVITDQIMYGMNGDELIKKLKEINPDVQTVLLTGYADIKAIDGIINRDGLRFIDKPWEKSQITQIISDTFNKDHL